MREERGCKTGKSHKDQIRPKSADRSDRANPKSTSKSEANRAIEFIGKDGRMQTPVTHRINATALELLEQHPEGLRWSELVSKIEESDPNFHPKTVNGCVWKLVERFPDKVYKPSRGLFCLLKYESAEVDAP